MTLRQVTRNKDVCALYSDRAVTDAEAGERWTNSADARGRAMKEWEGNDAAYSPQPGRSERNSEPGKGVAAGTPAGKDQRGRGANRLRTVISPSQAKYGVAQEKGTACRAAGLRSGYTTQTERVGRKITPSPSPRGPGSWTRPDRHTWLAAP